ncbi:MAG: carbohydrate ABC transporter permease, partial [Clostridia bacterium]|nr:carbohydrate ABC transporter permease [Clostridia bacterium]
TFVGFDNFIKGFNQSDFMRSFANSAFITVASVVGIVLMTSMTAWYIVRIRNKLTRIIYYLFVFSMVVPFQMVMYTTTYFAFEFRLNNPFGIVFLYLGFGAGLSVFMFSGFIKSIPREIEEAATIDGCGPIRTFFTVIFPILKPTAITVAILNAMWIWNDYLLPYLVLGSGENKTLPVAVQMALTGGYGNKDMGALMAMLVLAILPIIIFYLFCQKYIIRGVVAGAVKG